VKSPIILRGRVLSGLSGTPVDVNRKVAESRNVPRRWPPSFASMALEFNAAIYRLPNQHT
jgi:hypothetical protein